MTVSVEPRELARDVVLAEHRPFEDSIKIVREKRDGKDAAVAVEFDDRNGRQRRGLLGFCRHHSKTWQHSGGFMGSTRVTGPRDLWMTWGGWGPGDSQEHAVAGGWGADQTAVTARLIDGSGRVLTDAIENGVFLFMWKRDLNLQTARLDLIDANAHVLRSGPMRRRR